MTNINPIFDLCFLEIFSSMTLGCLSMSVSWKVRQDHKYYLAQVFNWGLYTNTSIKYVECKLNSHNSRNMAENTELGQLKENIEL